jgi:hypothetical protein
MAENPKRSRKDGTAPTKEPHIDEKISGLTLIEHNLP